MQNRTVWLVGSAVVTVAVVVGAIAVVANSDGASKAKPVAPSSVAQAVTATAKAKARKFTIEGKLTPAMAAYFGGSTLSGSGVADFTTDTARWSVTVPKQVGGTINVVARGNMTWVDVGARGEYVELATAADYVAYDRVPLVRDLVEVTNPFRDLNLADSTAAPVEHKPVAQGDAGGSPLVRAQLAAFVSVAKVGDSLPADTSVNLSGDCSGNNTTLSVEDEEVGTPDPKAVTSDFDITQVATEDDVLTSWNTTVTTQDVDSGVCSVGVSLTDTGDNGFDVVTSLDNPIPPVQLSTPNELKTVSVTTTQHFEIACDEGTWAGSSETEFAGYDTTNTVGTAESTVTQTPPTGGGHVTIELAKGSAVVTSDEIFGSTETVATVASLGDGNAPLTTSQSEKVTYSRHIDATGTSEADPSDDDSEVSLILDVAGSVGLTETGSFIGPRSTTDDASYELPATINCDDHTLTFGTDVPFGAIALERTQAAAPQLASTTTVTDWRTQILVDATSAAATQTPTPSPSGSTLPVPVTSPAGTAAPESSPPASAIASSATPTTPPAPLTANVLGATQAQWGSTHRPDPNIPGNYDPSSTDAYPGAPVQDQIQTVTVANDRVQGYLQLFTPHTTQSQADDQIRANLPADAILAGSVVNLGACAVEQWTSRSLAAADPGRTSGLITVSFTDSYDIDVNAYNAADVRLAFVNVSAGQPLTLTSADQQICG